MPLPPSERVVFNRNPLFAVSAQMRFPPILLIQVEAPAAFQEAIRADFPGYNLVNPSPIGIPPQVPAQVQAAMRASMQSGFNISFDRTHVFESADQNWVVQLAQESITMSCKNYPRWEVFRESLESVLNPFIGVYSPPYATMVGLRYQNAIEREKLGLKGVPWKELLQPFIAAEFGRLDEETVVSDLHRFEFSEGSDRILVQHGMATNQATKEAVYSIDNNLNTKGRVELSDVFPRLEQLNKHSGSLFRLCITERLYASLMPTTIQSAISVE
jgi:uncharacterized protein (TIGR04255 family)